MKSEIDKVTSVMFLAKMLIVDNAALSSTFSDVITAVRLFFTLPVTVASAESSSKTTYVIRWDKIVCDDLINQFAEMIEGQESWLSLTV